MRLNNVNRLIQETCHSPEGIARLKEQPDEVYKEFNLLAKEIVALRSMDPLLMVSQAGVHPVLAMHYLLACKPEIAESMNISEYPELFKD